MNEFDDVDRELAAAFTQRPSTLSRPSLRDVKQRARRHQRQRSAGVLGAFALVGVGGVAVIAQRSPSNETTVGGLEGDPTTTMCLPATTSVPATTTSGIGYEADTIPYTLPPATWPATGPTMPILILTYYEVKSGDNPTSIASAFGVTLEALNAANHLTPGYDVFSVGLSIAIPVPTGISTTTGPPNYGATFGTYTLAEGDFPGSVAEMFDVTVVELDAANREVPGYGGFIVGTVIYIPHAGSLSTTTLEPSSSETTTTRIAQVNDVDCYGQTPWVGYWRCSGAVGVEGPYSYFDVCEPVSNQNTEPTVSTIVFDSSTIPFGFTKIGTSIQVVNTSNQEGAAGYLANALAAEGFTMVEADTGTIDLPITKVIYNPDDPNALAVAQSVAILLGGAVVEASGPVVPALTLGTWAPGSGVIVLLGDDLAGKTLAQIAATTYTGSTAAPTSTTN